MHARTAALFYRYAPPLMGGIFILMVWEYVPAYFNVSKLLLPPPSSILHSLWLVYQRGLLVDNFVVTLIEALSGFALGSITAICFAFVVTRSLLIERALMPYLVGLQALPKVALAPLIVVWIGIGIEFENPDLGRYFVLSRADQRDRRILDGGGGKDRSDALARGIALAAVLHRDLS